MKSVTFFNLRSGAGTTLMAAHLCHLARERGMRVCADDQDRNHNLTRWLKGTDIPVGSVPSDAELCVHDVRSDAPELATSIRAHLWVMGIYDDIGPVRFIDTYKPRGPILWVPTQPGFEPDVPKHLRRRVKVWSPVLLRRSALQAAEEQRLVWRGPARASGGQAMHDLCDGILKLLLEVDENVDSMEADLEEAQKEILRAAAGILHCYSLALEKLSRSLASRTGEAHRPLVKQ